MLFCLERVEEETVRTGFWRRANLCLSVNEPDPSDKDAT